MNDHRYIRSLDGLRAAAIILVMLFHAEILHFGWMGVQLFFVLSGFLITGILWNEKARAETVDYKFKRFWVRRTLRIFPLYFGYLIFFGVTYLAFHFPHYYGSLIPYLATYTFNFIPVKLYPHGDPLFAQLWSLSIEEQFYLFFPIIIFLCNKKLIKTFIIVVICLAPLIRYLLGEYYKSKGYFPDTAADIVYRNTLSHLDAFFLGGIIPVFSLSDKIKKPATLFVLLACVAAAAGIWEFSVSDSPYNFFRDLGYTRGMMTHYENVWQYSLLNLLFASFILLLLRSADHKIVQKIFEAEWAVQIGKVSYGMYVFHWAIVSYFYKYFFWSNNVYCRLAMFIPYLAVVYFLAYLSYRFYESYFIKMKDRFFPEKIESEL